MTPRVLKRFFWMKSRCFFFFLVSFFFLLELQRHEEKREEYRRKEPCLASIQRAVSFGEGSLVSSSPCDSGISFWAFFYFHLCLFFFLCEEWRQTSHKTICAPFFFSCALEYRSWGRRYSIQAMLFFNDRSHIWSTSIPCSLWVSYQLPWTFPFRNCHFLLLSFVFFFYSLFSFSFFFSLIRRKRCWKP